MDGTEIISFLSNNLTAVLTPVSAIAGSLLAAFFLRYNTATKEFEEIKSGQFEKVTEELLHNGIMSYTEFYKAKNFLEIARKADNYYSKSEKRQTTEAYDFDWFVRFYEAVGNISNERMQEIWACILSREVCFPGSFSLKTVDVLKNLGKKDAELFEKICSYAIKAGRCVFVPNYESYLKKFEISYSEIIHLDELGLINCSDTLVLKAKILDVETILFNNYRLLVTAKTKDGSDRLINIKQFLLTEAGRELYGINKYEVSDDCVYTLATELSKYAFADFAVHDVLSIDGDDIVYSTENLLNKNNIR